MQVVILAAGRGSRLAELSQERTKAMQPVAGQPVLARLLSSLLTLGLSDFVLVVQPGDHELRRYFLGASTAHTGRWQGCSLRLVEQAQPRGMADALAQAAPWIHDEFLLAACDSLYPQSDLELFMQVWRANPGYAGLLALLPVALDQISRRGIVSFDGAYIHKIVEKPTPAEAPSNLGSLPLYIFQPAILDLLAAVPLSPRGEVELQSAIQVLLDQHAPMGGVVFTARHELTNPADLLALNLLILAREYPAVLEQPLAGVSLHPPYRIEAGAQVAPGCSLGPAVYLESGCQIASGAHLSRCVVLRTARVPAHANLSDQIIF